jgi:hypothetical protein
MAHEIRLGSGKVMPPSPFITLNDFRPALEAMLETESEYTLVNGLAVGVWAEVFLSQSERDRFDLPIRSKDIDIRAAKSDAMMLLKNLKERGSQIGTICKRTPKDTTQSFPAIAVPIQLPGSGMMTTVEALSGMPTLDTALPDGTVETHGTTLRFDKLQVLDPCSLMICKLNALNTRPAGQSDNDSKHATILSLVIPRFIQRALERHQSLHDPYHPGIDARRLAGFLKKDPWAKLIPKEERRALLDACALVD